MTMDIRRDHHKQRKRKDTTSLETPDAQPHMVNMTGRAATTPASSDHRLSYHHAQRQNLEDGHDLKKHKPNFLVPYSPFPFQSYPLSPPTLDDIMLEDVEPSQNIPRQGITNQGADPILSPKFSHPDKSSSPMISDQPMMDADTPCVSNAHDEFFNRFF